MYIDWIAAWFQCLNLHSCIWTFPNKTSGFWSIIFIHPLVNKCQEILENSIISRKLFGCENELTKYDITNTYNFVSTPSTAISGKCFREALGNRQIFMSWAWQFAQRVDSASCWYNWLLYKGFSTKGKLSKFCCILPLIILASSECKKTICDLSLKNVL